MSPKLNEIQQLIVDEINRQMRGVIEDLQAALRRQGWDPDAQPAPPDPAQMRIEDGVGSGSHPQPIHNEGCDRQPTWYSPSRREYVCACGVTRVSDIARAADPNAVPK